MANLKLMNNEMAVSPIVATLVLIVVAVIGAVAVGTIMGTFSTDVSKQAQTGQVASASNTEILIAGSTTVQPAALNLAQDYMKAHPGIKVTVQGGGSGAGFQAINNGLVDIGAMSEDYTKNTKYVVNTGVTLNKYVIGGSGIVVIAHPDATHAIPATLTTQVLVQMFSDGTTKSSLGISPSAVVPQVIPATVSEVVTRSDASGTADTFYKVLGFGAQITPAASKGAVGNEGVLAEVQNTAGAVGFVDMGYANILSGASTAPVVVESIDDTTANNAIGAPFTAAAPYFGEAAGGATFTATKANLKTAAQDIVNKGYVAGTKGDYPLARGLFFLTNGVPNSVTGNFITFAQSPGAQTDFNNAGMFSLADLAA
jgi:phosphate transport system substrate-binding protein